MHQSPRVLITYLRLITYLGQRIEFNLHVTCMPTPGMHSKAVYTVPVNSLESLRFFHNHLRLFQFLKEFDQKYSKILLK